MSYVGEEEVTVDLNQDQTHTFPEKVGLVRILRKTWHLRNYKKKLCKNSVIICRARIWGPGLPLRRSHTSTETSLETRSPRSPNQSFNRAINQCIGSSNERAQVAPP